MQGLRWWRGIRGLVAGQDRRYNAKASGAEAARRFLAGSCTHTRRHEETKACNLFGEADSPDDDDDLFGDDGEEEVLESQEEVTEEKLEEFMNEIKTYIKEMYALDVDFIEPADLKY